MPVCFVSVCLLLILLFVFFAALSERIKVYNCVAWPYNSNEHIYFWSLVTRPHAEANGLEACGLNKSKIASLDFIINRFFMKLFNTNNIETVKACQDSSRLNYLVTSWRNVVKFESKMKCLITVRLCIHVLYTSLFAQKEQHRRKQTIKKQQQTLTHP